MVLSAKDYRNIIKIKEILCEYLTDINCFTCRYYENSDLKVNENYSVDMCADCEMTKINNWGINDSFANYLAEKIIKNLKE